MVTDNLDRVLVSTNCTVTTKTPELARNCSFCCCVGNNSFRKRKSCYVVNNTDCEVTLRSFKSEVIVNCEDGCRSCILRTKTVTTTNNLNASANFVKSSNNVKEERFTKRTGLFCSVKNCNLFNCCGNCFRKLFSNERTVKSYLYKTNLSPCNN